MKNPKIAAAHFNTRFIATEKSWFGGGCINPAVPEEQETKSFHQGLENLWKKVLTIILNGKMNISFKTSKRRGVGGIFRLS